MLRSEFQNLLPLDKARQLTEYEWDKIELVYTYHPSNLDKKATAALYDEFGIGIFKDMEPAARKAKSYDIEIMSARAALTSAQKAYDKAVKDQDAFIEWWRSQG